MGATHKDSPRVAPIWDALYEARADVVLSGHDHNFQQLAPLDKLGRVDRRAGHPVVRGGHGRRLSPTSRSTPTNIPGAAEVTLAQQAGVLVLTLEPGGLPLALRRHWCAGGTGKVLFEGRDECH